jgi:Cd2+/Zn2+-exporting ATPase
VLVGNERLLKKRGVNTPDCDSIYTVIHVAKDGEYLGWIEVGDRLKEEAHSAVQELKSLGIQRFVVLTGDRYERAQKIANEVGVYEVKAQLLPDEKLLYIEELKKDGLVMYVGDGVNDAPVMSVADCSVSMGTLGSAAAVEASDFVLISDDLKGLGECVRTAKRTRSIVMQNILFSIAMKTAFMVLGAAGVLPLWLAVFADVGVMLLAVLNSFRVHLKEKKHA